MTGHQVYELQSRLVTVYEREGPDELAAVVGNLSYTEKMHLVMANTISRAIARES